MRPRYLAKSEAIRALTEQQLTTNLFLRHLYPAHGQQDVLYTVSDELFISECDDGRFFIGSIHQDPQKHHGTDLSTGIPGMIENMGDYDGFDKVKHYKGIYMNTLQEAMIKLPQLEAIRNNKWPKEFNPPRTFA